MRQAAIHTKLCSCTAGLGAKLGQGLLFFSVRDVGRGVQGLKDLRGISEDFEVFPSISCAGFTGV